MRSPRATRASSRSELVVVMTMLAALCRFCRDTARVWSRADAVTHVLRGRRAAGLRASNRLDSAFRPLAERVAAIDHGLLAGHVVGLDQVRDRLHDVVRRAQAAEGR